MAYQTQRAVQGRQWRFKDAQAAEGQGFFQGVAREAGQAEAGDGGLLDGFGIAQLQRLREPAQMRQQRLFNGLAGA
ncbi:hypothetical protein D3C72_2215000 [compost metagenome]